jgi:hypothetical protein
MLFGEQQVPGDQVHLAVAVPGPGGASRVVASKHFQRPARELTGRGLFKINDGGDPAVLPLRKPFFRHVTHGHDIHLAFAPEIGGDASHGPIHRTDRVMLEGEFALVLQPLNAVVRLEQEWFVENVAVDIKHVEVLASVVSSTVDEVVAPASPASEADEDCVRDLQPEDKASVHEIRAARDATQPLL